MLRDIYIFFSILANQPPYETPGLSTRIGFKYQNPQLNPPNDFSVRQSVPGTRCIFAPRFFSPLRYCLETVKHYQVLFNISNIICSLSLCLSKGLCYFSIINMQNFGNYRIKDVHHPAANANPLTKYMVWLQSKIQPFWLLNRNRLLDIIVLVASFELLSLVTQAIQYIQSIVCLCVLSRGGGKFFFMFFCRGYYTRERLSTLSRYKQTCWSRKSSISSFHTRICNKHSTCLYASNS